MQELVVQAHEKSTQLDAVRREIALLAPLQHRNVVEAYGYAIKANASDGRLEGTGILTVQCS